MKKCLDCGIEKSRKGNYCKLCGYKHRVRPKGLTYIIKVVNRGWFKEGMIPWHTGKQLKIFNDYSKDLSGLHKWLRRHYGIPTKCELCPSTRNIEWANKDEKYSRDRGSWMSLCKKCHHLYDYKNFNKRVEFFT